MSISVNDLDLVVNALRQNGTTLAPWCLSDAEMDEMNAYLDECMVWPAHVMNKANPTFSAKVRDAKVGQWPVFSPRMEDIVCAPHFFEYALRGYPIAREYFGEKPRLYSMNCFWTKPASYRYEDTHSWHTDTDDRKQLAMFLFGTDTSDGDGAHLYQAASHVMQSPNPETITVTGRAGAMFFSDPRGMHMGLRPSRPRMLAWARWGVSDKPDSYVWDALSPVPRERLGARYPNDPALQEAIQLVVS